MRRYWLFSVVSVLSIAADQLSKLWARQSLAPGHPQTVIANYWEWELSFNPGSAFGLLAGSRWAPIVFTIIGVIACGAIILWLRKNAHASGWLVAAFGLVFGGAIGNVIDRLAFGHVTDFVQWHYKEHRWPTFNVADAALVVGVIFLLLFGGKKHEERRSAA